jgi:DNA (cytosine-5)-methyltransferase 1
MLKPQFILPIAHELVIDLFAGGGGASTGIEQAIGRHVDIAINHDPEAVALHQANHPQTLHYVSDVFEVDPVAVVDGRPVGMLWASPDCKHFSKAKGGKPVSKKIRGLAWVVVKWAKLVRPRVIFLENVEEFQTWGPLGPDDRPCPQRKGRTFQRWKRSLENLGYAVDFKEDRASDLGTPTIRKRLFLVARCDGEPIVFPAHTHGAPNSHSLPVKAKKLKPWRTAAECIDWHIHCPSIFTRAKPLADATLRRIAKGVMRYVVNAAEPFIVSLTHQGGERVESLREPFKTVTGAHRGEKALIQATISPHITKYHGESSGSGGDAPFPTITANSFHKRPGGNPPMALVSAFLAKHYGGVVGSDLRAGIGTVTSVDHHSLVSAQLVGVGGRAGQSRPRGVNEPTATGTSKADTALVTSNLIKLRGTSKGGQSIEEPLHTISAQGLHHAEVRAFLIKYYGTDQDPRLAEPMHTIPTKDRFGLVFVHGEPYAIVDIGMRMLTPRELYRAQGFPESYLIERGADGRALTKTAQVRMCGNSVCPPMAEAYVRANYRDQQPERLAA